MRKLVSIMLLLFVVGLAIPCFADLLGDDFAYKGEIGVGINKAIGNDLSLQATAGLDMDLEKINNFCDSEDEDGLFRGAVIKVYLIKNL